MDSYGYSAQMGAAAAQSLAAGQFDQQTMWPVTFQTTQTQGSLLGDKRYIGIVKSFNQGNGYGFLSSEEITRNFGQDIFAHQLEIDKLNGTENSALIPGTPISFTVVANKRGQPQARELRYEVIAGGSFPSTSMAQQAQFAQQYAYQAAAAQYPYHAVPATAAAYAAYPQATATAASTVAAAAPLIHKESLDPEDVLAAQEQAYGRQRSRSPPKQRWA
jgi:cold shock CspA family protein